MKVVIFGLGNFGMSLAIHLSDTGHDVVVADKSAEKVDMIKDKVSHAVVMDTTNENAYRALPLKDTDLAVVGIGEDEGTAVMTTALVKKVCKGRIIARSSSALQDTIFEAMGIDDIIHPEQEYAERLTKKINLKGSIDNFEIEGDYLVSEVKLSEDLIGKSVMESNFREKYHLNIVTILRKKEYSHLLRRKAARNIVLGMPKPDTVFEKDDVLLVFGKSSSIKDYLKQNPSTSKED